MPPGKNRNSFVGTLRVRPWKSEFVNIFLYARGKLMRIAGNGKGDLDVGGGAQLGETVNQIRKSLIVPAADL